jgi:hypothetical protein
MSKGFIYGSLKRVGGRNELEVTSAAGQRDE